MALTNQIKNEILRNKIGNRRGFNRTEAERKKRHKKLFGTEAPKVRLGMNKI